jgi:hypothetical protein
MTRPVPPINAARMIVKSAFQLTSAVPRIVIISVCSRERRGGVPELGGFGFWGDMRAVELVGRDLVALREPEDHTAPAAAISAITIEPAALC